MRNIFKKLLSLVIALALIVGLMPMSAITANADSWDLMNGGTVSSGQTATITCYGVAAWQSTSFEWESTGNTLATITGTNASGEVIYTRQINGSLSVSKIFCYGGEQYVIDVIKGSVKIWYAVANTAFPKITITEKESDVPTASAYDYIKVESSTSDDNYFYVTVAYNLVSCEQGAIMFGVESNNSGSYTILADLEHIVSAGVGLHTFTIPREEVNDEDVYVNIMPYPHGDFWDPLDSEKFKLKLTLSDDLLNQRENYYSITKPSFSILGSGENQLVGQDGYIVNYNGNQYTTNSSGRVLVQDTNDPTEDVLITKEGYYDHQIPKEVIRNFNRVYMHKTTVQEPYLDNFYMRYDGSNTWENVLYNSICFTELSSEAFDIYVSANWCGQPAMKIYLQQGEARLELTEGFNENVVLGSNFSATGGTIYLCLETAGKTYKFSPKIFVYDYNLKLDIDLGSQDETEISDDIPSVGGEKLKISCSMLDFLPVKISVSADGTITGTIGVTLEDKYQNTWYEEIKGSVSSHDETSIAETFKKLKKAEVPTWESKSSIGIGVNMSIIGYLTAHVVKESTNPDLVGTLQIDSIECAISIEGKASASVQQFYGVVPVYWSTELGLNIAFAFKMQKETPESDYWDIEMPRMVIEIAVSGSGSLGVSKIVSAGLKASGKVTITIHAPDYNFDSSSCYVQVTSYVIGEILTFKGELDFWRSGEEYLWGEEYEESLKTTAFSLCSDLSRYRVASVLNEETDNKEVTLQTEDGVNYTKKTFDSLSYSNSSVQTVKLSNGKTLFVWVDSAPGRSDINKAALYYTVFDPSTNEYTEVKMVKDDGTSDFTPQLTVGENGVYLVWANISDVADNDMSLADFSAMMEIAFMEFNEEENTFANYMQLTENGSLDMIPYAAESKGLPYVVWVNDEGGNLLATSNQVNLVVATFDGENWNTTVLQEGLNSITSMVAVSADEGVDVYYTMDNDLDYSTGADQELYRYAADDIIQVTENEYPESDLRLIDGKPVWLSNGCVTSMSGVLTNRFTANVYGTAAYDGGTVTLYSELTGTETASESIYAVFTHNGITGVPIKVADTDSIVRSIDAYFDGGNLCFYTTENSIVDGIVSSSAIVEYNVELPNSLVITGTSYNDYSLKSDGELVANVSVRNVSSLPIEKYVVTVYDEKVSDVRTTRIYVPTASGDQKTLEISIPIPSAIEEEYLTFGIQPVFLNGETGETTEGTVTVYPCDVSLEDFTAYNENSGVSVTLSVVNRGIKPIDDVDVVIYKIGDENTEIYSTTIFQIDVDDTEVIEFVSNNLSPNDILYATATSPYVENTIVNNEIHTAVINTPAQDSQMEETDNILNLDESKTLELSGGEYGLYAFLPEEDGWYAFFSESESDTYGILYDGSMNQLQSDDNDGENSNFKIIAELVGGETYLIKARFYSYGPGSFDLKAIKLVPAETIVIEQGDLIEGYPFESTCLSACMTPDNHIPESYMWSSNDTTVATVDSYGEVSYKTPGTATITVTSDSGLSDSIEVIVKEFPDISLDETKTVVIDENQKVGYFKFTPEEDGWYALYSVSEGDTFCSLYNATGSQLAYNNNNGDNSNFRVEYKMTAGETYVYKVEYYYSSTTGSFDVILEKMLAAESVSIVQGETLTAYIGDNVGLSVEFSPIDCIEENVTWTSSDDAVATVDDHGYVSMLDAGEVDITVTSENGLTAVCTITVTDYPTIVIGDQKTVEITDIHKYGYFYFTPEKCGTYVFYSISDFDTYGYLLNCDGSSIASDDDGGEGNNFRIEYALTAGETYLLKCRFYRSNVRGTFDVRLIKSVDADPMLGHSYTSTDNGDGTHTSTCSACGDTVIEEHIYTDGVCICGAGSAEFVLTDVLNDGDKVIIVNKDAGKAMSENDFSSSYPNYRASVNVTPADSKLLTNDSKIIWDVVKTEDGNYQFKNDAGETLAAPSVNSYLSFADTNNVWSIEYAATMGDCHFIRNTTAVDGNGIAQYVNWFERYDEFETYYLSNAAETTFAMQFYVLYTGGELPHVHTWGEGTVTKESTCAETGEMTFACACGETRTQTIAATSYHNYTYTDNGDGTHTSTCSVCGDTVTEEHIYTDSCCICGARRTEFLLTDVLNDGDKVIIVNKDAGKAMSENDFSSSYPNYRASVNVTPADGKLLTDDSKIIWDVVKTADGNYQFKNDAGKTLAAPSVNSYLSFADTNNVWSIECAATMGDCHFIRNTTAVGTSGASQYVNWFERYDEFETYYLGNAAETTFAMQFYVLYTGGELPHVHTWDEGTVTQEATCTETGEMTFACACGETRTQEIAAADHTVVTDAAVAPSCTESGLTEGSHCEVCGVTIVAQEVITATGHSYIYSDNCDGTHTVGCENCDYSTVEAHSFVDGVCVCGAAEVVAPIEDSSLKFVTTAFTMGAELKFVFIMTSATATKYPTTYVDVVVNGADGETTVRYNLEDMVQYGAIYRVEFAGLAAKNMGDSFTATIHAEAADGTQYVGVSMTASIADQIKATLRKSNSSAAAKTLAVDMLNYGAAAQQYFGYDTEHLVNGDLTAEELAYGTQEVPTIANTMSKTGTGTITVVTPSVTLRSKVTLNMLFNTANYTGDVSKLTYKVTDAATGEVVFTGTPVQQSGTIYKCVYDDVGAKRMRSNITIGIYDENDELVSQVQTWSVESYIADILGRSATSDTTRGLLENMIKYGDAAAAYLG
ncbi:MAG: Ig domain-containing protein [Faecousia sp.]